MSYYIAVPQIILEFEANYEGIDHCLEALREMIMCAGDMTPIPSIWSQKGKKDNPNSILCTHAGTLTS
jgi:hypothetical protein